MGAYRTIGGAEEIIKSELNYSQLCGKIISDNKSISDKILIYILSVQEERNVIDGHIPIECGAYTIDWINQFANKAVEIEIDEIRLPEYCYRFESLSQCIILWVHIVNTWFHRNAGVHKLADYPELSEWVRNEQFPVEIRFGLEICDFKESENLISELKKGKGFDFYWEVFILLLILLSIHKAEHWTGIGHLDAIKLFGHKPSYSLSDYYESLDREFSESNMYADQNSGAARRCPETASPGMDKELPGILKKNKSRFVLLLLM